jgi:multidrug resistance efflux pump
MFSIFGNAKRRWLWVSPALWAGVLVLTAGGWLDTATAQAPAAKPQSSPNEQTPTGAAATAYTVSTGDITRTILITGELGAAQKTDIQVPATRSSGSVTITYMALEGDNVKKGDKILEFDSSSLSNTVTEQQRQVDQAALDIQKTKQDMEATRCVKLNAVAQAEGNLKIAKLNYDIPKELEPLNNYLNYKNTYDKAVLALTKAKQDLANFEASYDASMQLKEIAKSQAEIQLKRTQNDIDLLTVVAPQDGVVIYGNNWGQNRKYQVGDVVFGSGGGMSQPIITLPDLSQMQVIGYIYDTELQFLSRGMHCMVHLDSIPGRTWSGKITSLTNVATQKGFYSSPQQKVFRAVIPLDSADLTVMKPGMSSRVEVVLSMASSVVAVPRQLLGVDAQGRYYVLKETGPKAPPMSQIVQIGAFGDALVQVLSGVNVGERLLPIKKTVGE